MIRARVRTMRRKLNVQTFFMQKNKPMQKFPDLLYLQVTFYPLEAALPKSIDALLFEPSFLSV